MSTLANGACLNGDCSVGWWGAALVGVIALVVIIEAFRRR